MARAPVLQTGGRGFESHTVPQNAAGIRPNIGKAAPNFLERWVSGLNQHTANVPTLERGFPSSNLGLSAINTAEKTNI